MRILAIRGENLASLAQRFEIDLTEEPLAGTGLFAITGDTGAGKSTILDALCLSLYGEYPRVATEGRERVLDPSGDEIQSGDARNILRRGAGEGFAQVDFIGLDGVKYQATWAVRRARSKATGRLQAAERRLDRLDGTANVASGIRDVDAAVAARTGLTYAQFCRTVLLAQGEFDTFLLASETERADLLEKITGTDIYSRISRQVHVEKDQRERQLREREAACQGIETLTAEARRELVDEQQRASEAALALDAALKALADRMKRADTIARARSQLAEAEATRVEVDRRWQAAAEQRAHLKSLQAVEPLRPIVNDHDRACTRLAKAETGRRASEDAERKAGERHARLQETSTAAQQRADAKRADVERLLPTWEEAARLDVELETARRELANAEQYLEKAESAAAAKQAEHKEAGQQRDALAERREGTEADLAVRAAHEPLHAQRDRISEHFDKHDRFGRELAASRQQGEAVTGEVTALDERLAASSREIATAKREIEQNERVLAERRAALAAIGLEQIDARAQVLQKLEKSLGRAHEAAGRRDDALVERNAAEIDIANALRLGTGAAERLSASEREHHDARLQREAMAQLADLADATASQQAEALRAELVDSEPCPVCGSTTHPYADCAASAAHALVEEIRKRRADLDARLHAAQNGIEAARGDQVTAEARHKAAAERASEASRRRGEAMTTLSGLLPDIVSLAGTGAIGIDALDSAGAADAPVAAYRQAIDKVEAAHEAIVTAQQQAARLRSECDRLDRRLGDLRQITSRTQGAIRDDESRRSELRATLAGHEERARTLAEQLDSKRQSLAPFLGAAGLTADDLVRDSRAARARIGKLGDEYGMLRDALDQCCKEIGTADEALQRAAAALDAANAEQDRSARAAFERREHVERLDRARAGLLGGEPTQAHRTRFERARQEAKQALGEVQRNLQNAEIDRARCGESLRAARSELEAAGEESRTTAAALAAALQDLGMEQEAARRLIAVTTEARAALEEVIAGIEQAVRNADTTAQTRRSDLAALDASHEEGSPEQLAQLGREHDRLSAERAELAERLAVVRETLRRDAETTEKIATALQEIEQLKADLDVWHAVHEAIGSADGAKFKRFAQGITLRHLIGLANQQLAALNPRYQLRQGSTSALALDVIDRDMGEEIRSPRSLSGGERFLVSLALGLALSGLEGRQSFVDTLFIDEGFGSLDRDTLDVAIDALETLQGHGRKVGLITHVQAMMDRIAVQVRVEKRGGGRSTVYASDPATTAIRPPHCGRIPGEPTTRVA